MVSDSSRDIVTALNELLHINVDTKDPTKTSQCNKSEGIDEPARITIRHLSVDKLEDCPPDWHEESNHGPLYEFSQLDMRKETSMSSPQTLSQPKINQEVDAYVKNLSSLNELDISQSTLQIDPSRDNVVTNDQALLSSNNNSNFKEEFNSDDATVSYDAMVMENLGQVLGSSFCLQSLQAIFAVLLLFGEIDVVFVPLSSGSRPPVLGNSIAFFGFAKSKKTSQNLLRCMHHIHNLTLSQLLQFSKKDIVEDLMEHNDQMNHTPEPTDSPRLMVSVCQKKHMEFLFHPRISSFASLVHPKSSNLQMYDINSHFKFFERTIVPRFTKQLNFQEANVYVKYLPSLFDNDDQAWHKFWSQFGTNGINSAKIIKPHFYNKRASPAVGNFGFVFYKDLRMAIRAVIATNNQVVNYEGQSVRIQTSFAIQKRHGSISKSTFGPFSEHMPAIMGSGNYQSMGRRYTLPGVLDASFITGVFPQMMHHHPQLSSADTSICSPLTPINDGCFFNSYYYSVPASTMEYVPITDDQYFENDPSHNSYTSQNRRIPAPLGSGPPPYGVLYGPYTSPYTGMKDFREYQAVSSKEVLLKTEGSG